MVTTMPEEATPGQLGNKSPVAAEAVVISRVTVNYVTTAIVFFVLGAVVASVVTSRSVEANRAENRELISQSLAAALSVRGANAAASPQGASPTSARFDVSADDDPSLGPVDAPVLMVEFSDFNCPYCEQFFRETLPPLLDAYDGQIRFVYRDFPILGELSLTAAIASECADEQGKYWEYHDLLFENQRTFDETGLTRFAEELNLDLEQFGACQNDPAFRDEVLADYAEAQRLRATGTPTFFINGRLVAGAQPLAVFTSIIDEELAAAGAASTLASS